MTPILGTAMWGWTTSKETCFELLDTFYEKGFREIDGATNYPINQNPNDFRKSEEILQEWIKAHGISDLKIMMKVGSLNNLRTPEHNLTKSFLLMNFDAYRHKFDSNLKTFMVHWDNRNTEQEISKSFEAFQSINKEGLLLGLSGIKHPEIYAKVNQQFDFDFRIQIKHNLLHSDYQKYHHFHGKDRFITYGINAGGLKLSPKNYDQNSSLKARGGDIEKPNPIIEKVKHIIENTPKIAGRLHPENFNHIGMIYAFCHPDIYGILLGTSKVGQLVGSLDFMKMMADFSYEDVFEHLVSLRQSKSIN